ncbi:MAG: 4'-phosphopantetheinyl transferase superfamily protein [Bdellovibrionota bacterium]
MNGIQQINLPSLSVNLLYASTPLQQEKIDKALHALEIEKINSFGSTKRKIEYRRSRWLMRQFLNSAEPLIANNSGIISWPQGILASLSHKEEVIAFAFTDKNKYKSIGIDIEYKNGAKSELAKKICSATEINLLKNIALDSKEDFSTLLSIVFSFKEAVFKAHYPIGKIWFYFDDFEIIGINLNKQLIKGTLKTKTSELTPKNSLITGIFTFFREQETSPEFILSSCVVQSP